MTVCKCGDERFDSTVRTWVVLPEDGGNPHSPPIMHTELQCGPAGIAVSPDLQAKLLAAIEQMSEQNARAIAMGDAEAERIARDEAERVVEREEEEKQREEARALYTRGVEAQELSAKALTTIATALVETIRDC